MSHVVTGRARIHDLDALEQAASTCGLELVRNQTTYNWFNAFLNDSREGRDTVAQGYSAAEMGHCEHALRKAGVHYEIGVVKAKDGNGYVLQWDQYGAGYVLTQALGGTEYPKLMSAYNEEVAYRELARQGYRITETENAQGEKQYIAVKG